MPLTLLPGGIGGVGGGRGGGGFTATWQNVELINRILGEVEEGLNTTANREMRQGSKKIAQDVLIPALTMSAYSSGVPIAPAMAATMRAKSDRVVTVAVGQVNPKLSGFKSGVGAARAKKGKAGLKGGRAATSRNYRTTLAWGSELGPYPGASHNHYATGRNERGHWVQPGVRAPGTLAAVKDAYADLLNQIIAKYSRYR
jgi:hypothetical protein